MPRTIAQAVIPAAGLALVLLTPPALAQTETLFCTDPITPYCASSATILEDDAGAKRCEDEVRDYVQRMHEFVACLDTLQEEARARAAEVEERFACMARGDTDCP